ncbi:MAG: hypothetical protein US36_C0003G0028 [Candidatus Wolfebacteria bacterium GW2011_GWC1_37_10]|uniref:DUF5640 domain-containing protein n=1 Tax=Candidatus Wolfebacteria bacterium GW2011_GWC1_37_10 TaxID=1619010 RepID=A0A0G0IG78_9BACT|nr:MAG: hypothetical protein US36_C0003G0028 [Candidatus Wolfebacteria bacterium GW2011_GWC1_37_10]
MKRMKRFFIVAVFALFLIVCLMAVASEASVISLSKDSAKKNNKEQNHNYKEGIIGIWRWEGETNKGETAVCYLMFSTDGKTGYKFVIAESNDGIYTHIKGVVLSKDISYRVENDSIVIYWGIGAIDIINSSSTTIEKIKIIFLNTDTLEINDPFRVFDSDSNLVVPSHKIYRRTFAW